MISSLSSAPSLAQREPFSYPELPPRTIRLPYSSMPMTRVRPSRMLFLGVLGFTVAYLLSLSVNLLTKHLSQRSLIYGPKQYGSEDEARVLSKYGLLPEECAIDLVTPDKTQLRAYWLPTRKADPRHCPTVLYLHV